MNNRTVQAGTPAQLSQGKGYALAFTSSFASGLSTVIGKWNLSAISPLLMNGFIFSVASVVLSVTLLPYSSFRKTLSITRKGWFWLIMFSITSWLAIWAYWAGIQRMDPSLAAFLNRSEVLVAITLGIIFLRERFTKLETVGLLLSIAGIVVMRLTLRLEYSSGFWLVLLGSLLFGITEFISKIAVRYVFPPVLTLVRNMFVAILYWIAVLAGGISFDGLDRVWLGVLALGITGPVLARMLYLLALSKLELSKVAVISQSQPVYVIMIALLVFGQLPSFREITGGILLTAGCLLMVVSRNSRIAGHRMTGV